MVLDTEMLCLLAVRIINIVQCVVTRERHMQIVLSIKAVNRKRMYTHVRTTLVHVIIHAHARRK